MRVTTLATLLVLQCSELCLSIRVPVAWNNGEVPKDNVGANNEVSVEIFTPEDAQKAVPVEYFQYAAKKPQFAVEIAAAHGVQSPENHYKAYPIRPNTGLEKPKLGTHQILQEENKVFQPLQAYIKNERHATPVSSNYEVFHPYKAEEPALQAIYKDPVLTKIRGDLENSKNRLQNYEQEAGKPDITKDEYRERPEQTDKKLFPHKNTPTQFEIHRPQRKPVYYQPVVKHNQRDQVLNQRFKHPWNQNYVKIRPVHYRPLKNHIHNLRQHHAAKYDDERNEYPQIQDSQKNDDQQDGYDIYETGKQKYVQLRNNLDESINKAVLENRPIVQQKLEIQNDDTKEDNDDEEDEDEFIPVKNYAQVRKTETVKHLPRAAAFNDADTYEEIQNAPRLREAVKSTKAQTVYTEEGYEDSAYDHAGEQKHASENEGHGGYLKQKEISEGKYKIPSLSAGYTDAGGSEYKDQVQHAKKWKENNKDNQEETESEDYSEDENEQTIEAHTHNGENKDTNRNKREYDIKNETELNIENNFKDKHANFKIPEINLNSTLLTEDEISSIALEKKTEPKKDNLKEKYPYYFKNIKSINKHSPLRYAENFKLIPKKSKGGTEFYDSRGMLECSEVDEVNPLPEKLKNGENPTKDYDNDENMRSKGEDSFDDVKKQPRLRGLGDKIDCFKAKYFGENPLDNPFFKEEIIANPEPVTLPSSPIYKLQDTIEQNAQESQSNKVIETGENLSDQNQTNIFILLDKLRTDTNNLQNATLSSNEEVKFSLKPLQNNYTFDTTTELTYESNMYVDILENIKKSKDLHLDLGNKKVSEITETTQNGTANNLTYNFLQDNKDVTKPSSNQRKKRATPFIYEPYKIIRETQNEASKKVNTLSNISPLIKQMQTSKVVDRVTRANQEPSRRKSTGRTYKDIGRNDRFKGTENKKEDTSDIIFVDVNADQRKGEPLYEVKPANHKSQYAPVEDKRAMTVEDYKSQTNKQNEENVSQGPINIRINSSQRRPVFDVSRYLPIPTDVQNLAESNSVQKSVTTTTDASELKVTIKPTLKSEESSEEVGSEEEYEEYEDEEEERPSTSSSTTTTTTTTQRPAPRRRRPTTTTTTSTTTTQKPIEEKTADFEQPKLRLVTRFRNYNQEQRAEQLRVTERPVKEKSRTVVEDDPVSAPKYREKKKKSSKSTLVTDTKKYGDDFDDMKKEEVDALIGIKHNMDEYKPEYEKEEEEKEKNKSDSSEESDEDFISSEETDDAEDDEDLDEDDEDEEENQELKSRVTTPEPMKRTLIQTTDAPKPTIASRTTKPQEAKPIVSRKKVEIHKELPTNRASPHISQFKQDIKEEEVIKEMHPTSRRKPEKSIEALDLYKDDNLAKEINKLDDVEVFKEDLDLKAGPRHGGNYRSAEESVATTQRTSRRKVPKDAEASQSENTKHVELDSHPPRRLHGGNLKSISDIPRSRNKGRNAKLIELSDATDPPPRPMHGGNLRYDSNPKRGRGRSEKLIELEDDHHEDSTPRERNHRNYGHSRTGHAMHGGNYRSEKFVDKSTDSDYDIRARKDKDVRRNAALSLNSFAQAVPLLTTTPAYILDPSKRMYYYVET